MWTRKTLCLSSGLSNDLTIMHQLTSFQRFFCGTGTVTTYQLAWDET
jgi:hypothetical protein